jgi:hypothetical protein
VEFLRKKNKEIAGLITSGHKELVPERIIIPAFKNWLSLLYNTFPGFAWRGNDLEKADGFNVEGDEYFRILYERFFHELEIAVLKDHFTKEEIVALKEKSWEKYLKK